MFKKYGNWVANTRMPQFPFVRRLAKSNPEDFGRYVLYVSVSYWVGMALKNWQIRQLRENTIAMPKMNFSLDASPSLWTRAKTLKAKVNQHFIDSDGPGHDLDDALAKLFGLLNQKREMMDDNKCVVCGLTVQECEASTNAEYERRHGIEPF